MVEKDAQVILGKWIKNNKHFFERTTAIELKIEKGTSIRFDRVAEHQAEALLEAKNDGNYAKINDMPFIQGNSKMRFTTKKPFDCFLIKKADAFVVILFYIPRKKKEFLFIDIEDFINEVKKSDKKSMTMINAKAISRLIITI